MNAPIVKNYNEIRVKANLYSNLWGATICHGWKATTSRINL